MPATRVMKDVDQLRALDMSGIGNGPFIWGADNEPEAATFSFAVFGIAPAATPTDFLTLANNSASKVFRLKSIVLSGTATAAANIQVQQARRSAANTGGTFVAGTPVAHDTADGSSAATVGYYTANASALGTLQGILHQARLNLAPAANGGIDRITNWQYTWQNDKAVIVRPGQLWALNFNGQAWPVGGLVDVDLLWTEE